MKAPKIFVTVGTTQFDELVSVIDSKQFQTMAHEIFATREIVVQIGKGAIEPISRCEKIKVTSYRLKPDIKEDMTSADMIITHCGAGSVTEAMKTGKPTVAVVNNSLMDNHQTELAQALVEAGPFIFAIDSPTNLVSKLPLLHWDDLKKFMAPDLRLFAREIKKYIST